MDPAGAEVMGLHQELESRSMSRQMTSSEASEWMSGWDAVAARERQELSGKSAEEKLRALAFLMASTDLFDLSVLEAEDQIVRERWVRLRSMNRKR